MTLCIRVSYYKLQKANERNGGQRLLAGGVFFFLLYDAKTEKVAKEREKLWQQLQNGFFFLNTGAEI